MKHFSGTQKHCTNQSSFINFFPWSNSGSGSPRYRGFMITLRHTTLGRTPLDKWSSRRRDLHLTKHNAQKRQDIHGPGGIRTRIPSKRAATVLRQYRLQGTAFVRYIFVLLSAVTGPKNGILVTQQMLWMPQDVNRVIMSWSNSDTVSNQTSSLADTSSVPSEIIFVPWSLYLKHVIVSCSYRSFNVLSHGSQSSSSPYKKALLDIFWGFVLHCWSPKTRCHFADCWWDLCL
jgi:hypothetical protein